MKKKLTAALIASAFVSLLMTQVVPNSQSKSGTNTTLVKNAANLNDGPSGSHVSGVLHYRSNIAALPLASGDVDLAFDAGITTEFGLTVINAITVQPDGKILVGGFFDHVAGVERQGLARLNADGSLDATFNPPFLSPSVTAIVVQPDGRILVGGGFGTNVVPSRRMIVRLNADGSLDSTFNLIPSQSSDSVSSIAIEPDGKVIIGGGFFFVGSTQVNGLARLNSNGSPNTGLGFAAGLANSLSGTLDVKSIALQMDGQIVIGGEFLIPTTPLLTNLTRLNSNGTLDASFNNLGANAPVNAVAIQPEGKILAAGSFSNVNGVTRARIARINTDGSVEATFVPSLSGSVIVSLLLQTDGKILIGGAFTSVSATPRNNIARLNANGSLDSFYPNGTPGGTNGAVQALARQTDGKVLIGGVLVSVAGIPRSGLARLLEDAPVNSPPNAVNDAATTNEDNAIIISVLTNDTDPDGDALTISSITQGANGSVLNNGDSTLTYTPNANFNGGDAFTYTISDGNGGSDTATVTVTVSAVNDPPVAGSQSITTNEDTSQAIVLSATDVDGDPLTYAVVGSPANGNLTGGPPNLTYTTALNYNGLDSLTFKANDGVADSNIATVSIAISAVNDAPQAVNDSYTTNEDTALTVAAPGVLGNDADIDSLTMLAVLVSGPAQGALILNANGSFSYTPTSNYNGNDSFTYIANDGGLNSNVATVNIIINAVNDPPVAVNDSYSTPLNTPLAITAPGVLANDSDVDNPALTAVLVSSPAQGTLSLNANGSFTYTPALSFVGTVSFTYQASDGAATSNTATVAIVINPVSNPIWSTTGGFFGGLGRSGHTATLLPNGKVLVVGGFTNQAGAASRAELYDPATGVWTMTGSLLPVPGFVTGGRANHTATLLPNGKVLVAGGLVLFTAVPNGILSNSQLYDPATGTWSTTGSFFNALGRSGHTATLLPNGKVLVVGGFTNQAGAAPRAELYDPATGTWSMTGSLLPVPGFVTGGRANHTATLLPNGKVLVAGGLALFTAVPNGFLSNSQLYDPATGTWSTTGSFFNGLGRSGHTATLLPNGKVLVVGGFTNQAGAASRTELYDPATGIWTMTGSLLPVPGFVTGGRANHTATLLPNGKVLVAGGLALFTAVPQGILSNSQLFDPATGTWSTTGSLNAARTSYTATLLPNGKVLAAGGLGSAGLLASAELYGP